MHCAKAGLLSLLLATAPAVAAARDATDPTQAGGASARSLMRSGGELLEAGQREIEPGFAYEYAKGDGSLRKSYTGSLTLRAGLPWSSQIEIVLPYGRENLDGTIATGRGDLQIGVAKEFATEGEGGIGWIGALSWDRTTRRSQGALLRADSADPPPAVGQGHDALHASITAVKSTEVVDFVLTLGHVFARPATVEGVRLKPGNAHTAAFSAHWEAGRDVSLRAGLNGYRSVSSLRKNGVAVDDSRDKVASVEAGASISLSRRVLLDVAIGLGITRDAPDFSIGISLPILF